RGHGEGARSGHPHPAGTRRPAPRRGGPDGGRTAGREPPLNLEGGGPAGPPHHEDQGADGPTSAGLSGRRWVPGVVSSSEAASDAVVLLVSSRTSPAPTSISWLPIPLFWIRLLMTVWLLPKIRMPAWPPMSRLPSTRLPLPWRSVIVPLLFSSVLYRMMSADDLTEITSRSPLHRSNRL